MKRIILIAIIALSIMSINAAVFTDSLGRTAELPDEIERIVPSGNLAQLALYSIAPEKIVGWSSHISGSAADYFLEGAAELPVFGTFYGKKANLNREALMVASPDVVIDMGEIKGSRETMSRELDDLEKSIMTPVVFIESYLDNTPEAFRTLGYLLGKEEKCEKLATFTEEALEMAKDARSKITNPVTVYYSSSEDGLSAIPEGSFHGEVIEKVGAENAVKNSFGSAYADISMEELFMINPDVILLSEKKAYDEVMNSPLWGMLDAVRNGKVYLIPSEPYPFIDNPPATNRIIGIYWLGNLLYPELYPVDITEKTIEFYELFYGYELSREAAERILYID